MTGLMTLIRDLRHWNPAVRGQSASALGRLGDTRAVPPLMEALRDGDPEVRARAATALGRLGDVDAAVPLAEALGDRSGEVCRRAAEALGMLGAENVVPRLSARLTDAGPELREGIAAALARMGDPGLETLASLLTHPALGETAAHALVSAEGQAVPTLYRLLRANWNRRLDLRTNDPTERPRLIRELAAERAVILGILDRICRVDPVPALREVLPLLELFARYCREPLQGQLSYRGLAREIDRVTNAMRHLPLPAADPLLTPEALPIPDPHPHASDAATTVMCIRPSVRKEGEGVRSVLARLLRALTRLLRTATRPFRRRE